jgi:hypothetical protein
MAIYVGPYPPVCQCVRRRERRGNALPEAGVGPVLSVKLTGLAVPLFPADPKVIKEDVNKVLVIYSTFPSPSSVFWIC